MGRLSKEVTAILPSLLQGKHKVGRDSTRWWWEPGFRGPLILITFGSSLPLHLRENPELPTEPVRSCLVHAIHQLYPLFAEVPGTPVPVTQSCPPQGPCIYCPLFLHFWMVPLCNLGCRETCPCVTMPIISSAALVAHSDSATRPRTTHSLYIFAFQGPPWSLLQPRPTMRVC